MPSTISGPDEEHDDSFKESPRLRTLRLAVTGMMVVMAVGFVVITATIVIRLSGGGPATPVAVSAESIALPAGFAVTAIGAAGPHLLLLGRDASGAEVLLTLRKADGAEIARTAVIRTP
jgi:hypothetical protein